MTGERSFRRGVRFMLYHAAFVLARASGIRVGVALVYHSVAERAGRPDGELVPPIAVAQLRRHLDWIGRHMEPVRASQLPSAVRARRRWQRFPVAVTFDDDLASHATEAAPILRERHMPATFFLGGPLPGASPGPWWYALQAVYDRGAAVRQHLVACIGGGLTLGDAVHDFAARVQWLAPTERAAVEARLFELAGRFDGMPRLSSDDVACLARDFEVGFHTLRHHQLTVLNEGDLDTALREGRRVLEQLTQAPIDVIAYPHGAADSRVGNAARRAGYNVGFTTGGGVVRSESDAMLLGRQDAALLDVRSLAATVQRSILQSLISLESRGAGEQMSKGPESHGASKAGDGATRTAP